MTEHWQQPVMRPLFTDAGACCAVLLIHAAPTPWCSPPPRVIAMGMDASDLDIPPLGAAAQLAMSRELRRTLTEAQGAVADLQQFPPGYAVSAAEKFQERHDQRCRYQQHVLYERNRRSRWQQP